ncbi:MAG TPA: hypothetical protein DDZ80_17895 [Cyanobacteria bacterium UBA8803]|nr:hypothetical protein [Cyanobacteria bacterium UBA9273]HBL60258.1 hypothetical protein [Cyanobacteria bacterium UBA8803]
MLLKIIKRPQLILFWRLACILFVLLYYYPISYGILRLATVVLGLGIWLGAFLLFKHQKLVRVFCIGMAVIAIAITLLPGRNVDSTRLRQAYVEELNSYTGTQYLWGGENKIGIDCSGLVRRGLINANVKQGLSSLNPQPIREAISLWWYDASAAALRDEYRNKTTRLERGVSINKLEHSNLQMGDIAVTVDGVHTLAYIGDNTWIEADPHYQKVIKVKIPDLKNPWFNVPIYIVRWQQFETG